MKSTNGPSVDQGIRLKMPFFTICTMVFLQCFGCKFSSNKTDLESVNRQRSKVLLERDIESIPSPGYFNVRRVEQNKFVKLSERGKTIDFIAQENIRIKVDKDKFIESFSKGKPRKRIEDFLQSDNRTLSGMAFKRLLKTVKEPKLGPLADCREEPITTDDIQQIALKANDKISFLKQLNKKFPNSLQNMTLLHSSDSIVERNITPENPRLIRFSTRGDIFLSWTCADDAFEPMVEILAYDEEDDDFFLQKIDFGKKPNKRIERNAPECLICHSTDLIDVDVVGFWDRYPLWIRAYGGSDDGLSDDSFLSSHKSKFLEVKKRRHTDECLAQLPWEDNDAHPYYEFYPFHEEAGSKPNNYYVRSNVKINDALLRRTAAKIARRIRETSAWKEIKPLVLEALLGCSDAGDLDTLFQETFSDYKSWTNPLAQSLSARQESTRYGNLAFPEKEVAQFDPRFQSETSRLLYNLSIASGLTNRHWNPSPGRYSAHFITGIKSEFNESGDLSMAQMVKAQLIDQSLDDGAIKHSLSKGNGTELLFGPDFQCLDSELLAEVQPKSQEKTCKFFRKYYGDDDERAPFPSKGKKAGFSRAVQSYQLRLNELSAEPNNETVTNSGRKHFRTLCASCHNRTKPMAPKSFLFVSDPAEKDSSLDYFLGYWFDYNLGGESYLIDSIVEKRMPPDRPIESEKVLKELASYIELIGQKSWIEKKSIPIGVDQKAQRSRNCALGTTLSTCKDENLSKGDADWPQQD